MHDTARFVLIERALTEKEEDPALSPLFISLCSAGGNNNNNSSTHHRHFIYYLCKYTQENWIRLQLLLEGRSQGEEDEAAQCGLQQTKTAVKTEPNHRGDIRQVTYTEQVSTTALTKVGPCRVSCLSGTGCYSS
ncbi:hypothetical protein GOODEAATRI_029085 [Goodea atripinnis]|uniref:Uncharacterized protein n=1 Tax=Goodea atripinnis TaxID=208336 RepID=A0ABV0NEK6_9TELE